MPQDGPEIDPNGYVLHPSSRQEEQKIHTMLTFFWLQVYAGGVNVTIYSSFYVSVGLFLPRCASPYNISVLSVPWML